MRAYKTKGREGMHEVERAATLPLSHAGGAQLGSWDFQGWTQPTPLSLPAQLPPLCHCSAISSVSI